MCLRVGPLFAVIVVFSSRVGRVVVLTARSEVMNEGTARGEAWGFRLESLRTLTTVRSPELGQDQSLLDYLVQVRRQSAGTLRRAIDHNLDRKCLGGRLPAF